MKHSGLSVFLLVGLTLTPAFALMSGGNTHYVPEDAENQARACGTGNQQDACGTPPQESGDDRAGHLFAGAKSALASNQLDQPTQ